MSDYPVKHERDHVEVSHVIKWLVFTVSLFGVGGLTIVTVQKHDWGTLHQSFNATPAIKHEMVGMIYQHSFDYDYGLRTNHARRDELGKLKWTDEKHQTAQIPIERAMDMFAKRGGTL